MLLTANGKNGVHGIAGIQYPICYYCGKELGLEFDYSCTTCGRITCDNHNDVCQEEYGEHYAEKGCDLVTCFVCLKAHTKAHHPNIP